MTTATADNIPTASTTEPAASHAIWVAVATPAHSSVSEPLSYLSPMPLPPGTLVRVPLGRREVLGVVWDAPAGSAGELPEGVQARSITGVLEGITPLSDSWRRLTAFTARYYQRALGEVALAALPPQLRDLTPEQMARRIKRKARRTTRTPPAPKRRQRLRPYACPTNNCRPPSRSPPSRGRSCSTAAPAAARPRSICTAWNGCSRPIQRLRRW